MNTAVPLTQRFAVPFTRSFTAPFNVRWLPMAALVGLVACVSSGAASSAATGATSRDATSMPPQPPPQAVGLTGTAWVVTAIHDGKSVVSVLAGSRPTVQFGADGRLSGVGGCNRFSGRYREPAAGSVEISALASSRRACEPDELMAQETALLRALETARSLKRDAGRLELRRADGAVAATLTLAPG